MNKEPWQYASDNQSNLFPSVKAHLDKLYMGLEKLRGMVKAPMVDASTSIDDVVYGRSSEADGTRQDKIQQTA